MNWRKHIIHPLICAKNNENYLKYLAILEKSQFFPAKIIAQQKIAHLNTILSAAQQTTYYSKSFEQHGVEVKEISNFSQLGTLPKLTKRNVQENLDHMLMEGLNEKDLIKDKTGGSTASPIEFYYTADKNDWRTASEFRHNKWAGFDIGTKAAFLWGAPHDFKTRKSFKGRIYDYLTSNSIILDASAISDETCRQFTEQLNNFKPDVIQAYARTLGLYARYLRDNNIKIHSPASIITSAEVLTDNDRTLIESIFKSKIYNRYGSREFSVMASECSHGNMHINDECYHLEFVRSDGSQCGYGEEGEILVTDLLNTAMPMIRYQIGDTGILLDKECPCGRNLSVMKIETGRITDFLCTPTGKKVSGVAIATFIITNIDGIGQVQFHQKEKQFVEIRLVKNDKFNEQTLRLLEEKTRYWMDDINVKLEIVDEIKRSASGKMLFCINEIKEN